MITPLQLMNIAVLCLACVALILTYVGFMQGIVSNAQALTRLGFIAFGAWTWFVTYLILKHCTQPRKD